MKFDPTRTLNLNPQLRRTHWILVPINVLELNGRSCFKIIKVRNEFENKEFNFVFGITPLTNCKRDFIPY